MDYSQFENIFIIPLPETPNSSFSVVLAGLTFDIEFRAMGERMLVYISIGDMLLCNGIALKFNAPINVASLHSYSGGLFWFEGSGDPVYENFSEMRFYFGSF